MKRTQYTPNEKAKIVVEILQGDQTIGEISSIYGIHPNMLARWKREALDGLPKVFERSSKQIKQEQERQQEIDELYKQIGILTTQNEWLKKKVAYELTVNERKELIEPKHPALSIRTQASLLSLNRSTLYYQPKAPNTTELAYKEAIDQIHTKAPFFGSRRIALALADEYGYIVNRKAVQRHMREMGIKVIYPRQHTSKPNKSHLVYPYLLDGLHINRPNQVWAIDITYIPLSASWLYLTAIIDWYSRYIISWELNDSLEMSFVLEASRKALSMATPEIMNSDQGSHFTSHKFTYPFLKAGSKISMDHRGRAFDNIMIERLWRTIKYENVYPMQYYSPKEARIGIKEYINFYNTERYHQSLDYKKPAEVYFYN